MPRSANFALSILLCLSAIGCGSPRDYFIEAPGADAKQLEDLFGLLDSDRLVADERYAVIQKISTSLSDARDYTRLVSFLSDVVATDPDGPYNARHLLSIAWAYSRQDADEIAIYRAVSAITDAAMDEIEAGVRSGRLATEADVALFIERFLRERGCESAGFDTLAAGPSRSFGIHAFPSYTAAAFATEGMSILDFGLSYRGYTSDVTMTFVRGRPAGKRAEMIGLVRKAHADAIAACRPGVRSRDVALIADAVFAEKGYVMPHALGHGVGLEAHEAPAVRSREDNEWVLAPGHVITIEPGLYDPAAGGVRLEDDVLITETGCEVLTHARIVELG